MKIFKKVGETWPIGDFPLHSQSFPFTSQRNRCKFLHSAPTQEGREKPVQKMRKQRRVAISCIPFALLASSLSHSHIPFLFHLWTTSPLLAQSPLPLFSLPISPSFFLFFNILLLSVVFIKTKRATSSSWTELRRGICRSSNMFEKIKKKEVSFQRGGEQEILILDYKIFHVNCNKRKIWRFITFFISAINF